MSPELLSVFCPILIMLQFGCSPFLLLFSYLSVLIFCSLDGLQPCSSNSSLPLGFHWRQSDNKSLQFSRIVILLAYFKNAIVWMLSILLQIRFSIFPLSFSKLLETRISWLPLNGVWVIASFRRTWGVFSVLRPIFKKFCSLNCLDFSWDI